VLKTFKKKLYGLFKKVTICTMTREIE
jgi:hypothetical protein